jgi:hypothetical protein
MKREDKEAMLDGTHPQYDEVMDIVYGSGDYDDLFERTVAQVAIQHGFGDESDEELLYEHELRERIIDTVLFNQQEYVDLLDKAKTKIRRWWK